MRRKQLVSVFAISALAGVLGLSGCTSAATKTSTPNGPAGTQGSASFSPAGPQIPKAGGTVQITDYTNNDGTKSTVILTGVIGDFGEAVSIYPNGTIDPEHNSELKLALTHGSFRLDIANLDKKIVSAFSDHFPMNTKTCSGTAATTATATPIVAGSGTGAYRGIGGTFNMTVSIAEVDPKLKCGTGQYVEAIFITGSGTVSLS